MAYLVVIIRAGNNVTMPGGSTTIINNAEPL